MTLCRKEIMCVYREREKEKGAQTKQNKTKIFLRAKRFFSYISFFLSGRA